MSIRIVIWCRKQFPTSVSRESAGQNNLFMVGDVKQSIYRFRLSRPELFMGKYNSYSTQESSRQRIDLDRNFRSRGEVLDSTNYIFRKLMRKEFGEIIYDDKAALHLGASFLNYRMKMCLRIRRNCFFIIRRGFGAVKERRRGADDRIENERTSKHGCCAG